MERQGVVYLVTNLVNGKKYVGQTVVGLEKRWNDHVSGAYKHRRLPFQKAIVKYGRDAFDVIVLAEIERSFLNHIEQTYILIYSSMDKQTGYNVLPGGTIALTAETRCKIGDTKRGKPSGKKGYKCTPEQKQRMSISQRGRKATDETREKMSAAHKTRIAAAPGLYKKTEDHKRKLRKANLGKQQPEATRLKMSDTHKRRLAAKTPEEKRQHALKIWESRRANAAAKSGVNGY